MKSLLKSSDLVSAHILRGRLDAEGFEVCVVHENASQLWGGAVCGEAVLLAPEEAFPEIRETLASAEPVDPPAEASAGPAEDGHPAHSVSPGIFGALFIGSVLGGLDYFLTEFVAENLRIFIDILRNNPEWLSYGLPIPWHAPDWKEALTVLGGGALGGGLVFVLVSSLKWTPARCLAAGLILVLVFGIFGFALLIFLAGSAVLSGLAAAISPGRRRRAGGDNAGG